MATRTAQPGTASDVSPSVLPVYHSVRSLLVSQRERQDQLTAGRQECLTRDRYLMKRIVCLGYATRGRPSAEPGSNCQWRRELGPPKSTRTKLTISTSSATILLSGLSMEPGNWDTVAAKLRTTDVMTDCSESGRAATSQEQEDAASTIRPVLSRDRPVFAGHLSPGCP